MSAEQRFWAKVRKGKGCWEWTGTLNSSGYGAFWSKAGYGAHRASYLFTKGPVPPGLHVLHGCDNRRCVRPSHLRAGTHAENMHDMVKRGRSSAGGRREQCRKIHLAQPPLPSALSWCAGLSDAVALGRFNGGVLSSAKIREMQAAQGVEWVNP